MSSSFDGEEKISKEKKKKKKISGKSKKKKIKCKKRKKTISSERGKGRGGKKKIGAVKLKNRGNEDSIEAKEEEVKCEELGQMEEEEEEDDEDLLFAFLGGSGRDKKKVTRRESITSDPDPDSDEEWSAKNPCPRDSVRPGEGPGEKRRRRKRLRGRGKKGERKGKKEKKANGDGQSQEAAAEEEEDGGGDPSVRMEGVSRSDKETMTECYPGQFDHLYGEEKARAREAKKPQEPKNVFLGDVQPVLEQIVSDLAEEGYISASYPEAAKHPDIEQLCQYLRGEIVTKAKREELHSMTKAKWAKMSEMTKFQIPDLGISAKKHKSATWKDKNWIFRLAKAKKDEFYFKTAGARADHGREIYKTLRQNYFGTGRYLKIYYAYMLPKYEEAILRGVV